ncbi:hypothetical protein CPB84DRAFT_1677444 [Gymnopilus junonius]|uniref:Uncharacterized protein n=1 Tax=Gymnopilus junonius TaxID=109634 RepID=A0A9P5NRV4_GYMJU|nr:hypothetical protein CPB84DRAFT_1677444 [Gymnopilus junonius]
MECVPKLEAPDLIELLDPKLPPLVLLTEQIKEELILSHLPYPSHDSLCRFPKPPLRRFPPIWAEVCIHYRYYNFSNHIVQSRQEICESFDWFRSYQGGVYFAHDVAKGYLLGAFPATRDMFEHGGRLIISHGGGKAESLHSFRGHISSQPATDQLAHDKSIRALFNNYFYSRPLALLMDDKYALFPFDLRAKGVTYAVLGFYTIAHVWAEYQQADNENGRVVRFKFAFRWCEEQGQPWWHQKEEIIGNLGSYLTRHF